MTERCPDCGCEPCMCHMPGFVTYRGYTEEQALRSVGKGWSPLIKALFSLIEGYPVTVVQVKEKYGTLRVYINPDTGDLVEYEKPHYVKLHVDSAVRALERASGFICERCGQPGELDKSQYWVLTLCQRCKGARAAERGGERRWWKCVRVSGLVEAVCEHGVGHPIDDSIKSMPGEGWGVHGCDGCCEREDFPRSVAELEGTDERLGEG